LDPSIRGTYASFRGLEHFLEGARLVARGKKRATVVVFGVAGHQHRRHLRDNLSLRDFETETGNAF